MQSVRHTCRPGKKNNVSSRSGRGKRGYLFLGDGHDVKSLSLCSELCPPLSRRLTRGTHDSYLFKFVLFQDLWTFPGCCPVRTSERLKNKIYFECSNSPDSLVMIVEFQLSSFLPTAD